MIDHTSLLFGFCIGLFFVYLKTNEPYVVCNDSNICYKANMQEGKKCKCQEKVNEEK